MNYEILIGTRGGASKVKQFKNKTAATRWVDRNHERFDQISWPDQRSELYMNIS
jgi:hypothetical protein